MRSINNVNQGEGAFLSANVPGVVVAPERLLAPGGGAGQQFARPGVRKQLLIGCLDLSRIQRIRQQIHQGAGPNGLCSGRAAK